MTLAVEKNPVQLFPSDVLLNRREHMDRWWVAHTMSRQEKLIARTLACDGIGYFLPMVEKRQPCKRRVRFSLMPLFPGYIFFRGTGEDRGSVLKTRKVASIIDVKDEASLLSELRQIHAAIESGFSIKVYPFIEKGRKVRIASGPLKGIEGVIKRVKGNYRVVLSVGLINHSIVLEVDASQLESV